MLPLSGGFNVQVHRINVDDLDIPKFMPRIRQYFGHFSLTPTLRSLSLCKPEGSRREDLKLKLFDCVPEIYSTLCSTQIKLLKDMVDLFRGIN